MQSGSLQARLPLKAIVRFPPNANISIRVGRVPLAAPRLARPPAVRGCARETDIVARFGGDEFALILPDTGQEGAMAVAGRIRERVSAAQFLASDGLSLHLTVSIGVATLPDSVGSAEELLRAADAAMYQVKASGKNGIQAFANKEL